ncbi:MAG TPA: hypothetical protein VIY90_12245 [Steroidobacteraceae bacterium]
MSATVRVSALLALLLLAACAVPRPATQPVTPGGAVLSPVQLLAAVQSDADRIEQVPDAAQRAQLLAAATLSAQQCLALSADNAHCQYAQAQVLGLTAREHPLQAGALLKQMLTYLTKAEGLDPGLDHAGPARLTAVVLLRAPPWPVGPGDVDGALVAAQRAVQRDAIYPPNLITLAQAEAKSAGTAQARASFGRAQLAVQAWVGAADAAPAAVATQRAQWQRTIEQGLRDLQ